ncbi:hypothetical protein ACEPPN_005279 [Leptodophora sp. 'Broadleaf-Isolate-01']
MQINITFLSIVLALTSTGFGLPSNSSRFGIIGHELQEEDPPAQSSLSTLSGETPTRSPTDRRTSQSSTSTVSVETSTQSPTRGRTTQSSPCTPNDETPTPSPTRRRTTQSSPSTARVETSTQSPAPCGATGALGQTVTRVQTVIETVHTTTTITAAAEDTSMCLHTHSASGSGFLTHMMPCSLTGLPLAPPPPTSTILAAAEATKVWI